MERVKAQYEGDGGESNTGRWTKEEHDLFLHGLANFGKDWKQIGSLIKTRTVVQIRTHAQKYFLASKKHEEGNHVVNIPTKQTKEKKRPFSIDSEARPAKSKKRRDSNEDSTKDPGLESLDKIFDLVDAWSSGSDEGTPTSVEEMDFLKAPMFGYGDDREPNQVSLQSHVIQPVEQIQSQLSASHSPAIVPPPPPPTHLRAFSSSSGSASLSSGYYPETSTNGSSEMPHDISVTFDPLPPTMEYGLIGKWIDTIPAANEPL